MPGASSGTGCAGSSIPPAAHAAATMFATGATSSGHNTAAVIYSSSRRASNSRLIAEISPSSACTDSVNATRRRSTPARAAGT